MRIAVMGSGGVGGLVGCRLAAAGIEVLFIARGAHLEAMLTSGLRLSSDALGNVSLSQVEATDDPKGKQPVDFVIFTVKGPDTEEAAELIAPLIGPNTGIISFQNGVEGIDILAARYSSSAVLPGTTMIAAMVDAPGAIRHVGSGNQFTIGEWDGGISPRAEAFCDAAGSAGLNVTLSSHPHVDVWSKLVAMATFSALTCLTRLPVRTIVSVPETRQLALDSMNEVIAVAKARGVTVPADVPTKILGVVETLDPAWKTSMCNDLEAGKVIEANSISGAVHRLGEKLGVSTPVHTVAYRALKYFTLSRT